jgi:hypothetical protein
MAAGDGRGCDVGENESESLLSTLNLSATTMMDGYDFLS